MRTKKSLGQYFLKSEKALKEIVAAGELKPGETVLEIGPGTGILTKKLLETGVKIFAVEKDDELYKQLEKNYEIEINTGKFMPIHGDILDFEPEKYGFKQGSYKIIANIPYNITGAILKKFLSTKNRPKKMVLLVQKEVAERIIARSGKESILSIAVKVYGKPRYIETVKAGSFVPIPKVNSAIIAIENISAEFFRNISEKEFFALVQMGFRSKRKKLSSNLSHVFAKDKVVEVFSKFGIEENARAEDLNLESWKTLAENLVSTD